MKRGGSRLLRIVKRTLIATSVLGIMFILYLRPFDFSKISTIPDVGVAYAMREPHIFFDTVGAKERLAAIGLSDPAQQIHRLVSSRSESDHADSGGGTPYNPEAPVEDYDARDSLPKTTLIPGLTSVPGWKGNVTTFPLDSRQFGTWTRSNGDIYSSKYASTTQINDTNVHGLELAWSLDSSVRPGGPRRWNVETNPIFGQGLLFSGTPEWSIVAVKARTGELAWSFRSPDPIARRGMI